MPFAHVDTSGFDRLADALGKSQPEVEDTVAEGVAQAGELIAATAQANANGFSTSIPPTIVSEPIGARVIISAGSPEVLIAKWYEQGHSDARPDQWNHPVYPARGSDRATWHWAAQPNAHRPFLEPALRDDTDQAMDLMANLLADSIVATLSET